MYGSKMEHKYKVHNTIVLLQSNRHIFQSNAKCTSFEIYQQYFIIPTEKKNISDKQTTIIIIINLYLSKHYIKRIGNITTLIINSLLHNRI